MHSKQFRDRNRDGRGYRVDGAVGWLMEDVYSLQAFPKGVCGIGEMARSKGVGQQQISEFIRYDRFRYAEHGQQCDADGQGQNTYEKNRRYPPRGKTGDSLFHMKDDLRL